MCPWDHRKNAAHTFQWAFLVSTLLGASLEAHAPGLSSAELQVGSGPILVTMTFAVLDIATVRSLDHDLDGTITLQEFEESRPRLERLFEGACELWLNGRMLSAREASIELREETGAVVWKAVFQANASEQGTMEVRFAVLSKLPRGHRQFVYVKGPQGKALLERILDARNDRLDLDLALAAQRSSERPSSAFQFLALGVEHIFTGYDHLAFLFALLIMGGSLRTAVKIITSFTAAHSLTLAVATLGLVQISPRVVEPLIALSILYVGLENLVRKNLNRRWVLTFAFGLIHGFGFATVLREMGIGASGGGIVTPLLSFNLGVEVGQVTIAAVALPLILRLRSVPAFASRFAPAFSLIVSCLGGYWLLARTLL